MWPPSDMNLQVAVPDMSQADMVPWFHIPWDALVAPSAMARKTAFAEQACLPRAQSSVNWADVAKGKISGKGC